MYSCQPYRSWLARRRAPFNQGAATCKPFMNTLRACLRNLRRGPLVLLWLLWFTGSRASAKRCILRAVEAEKLRLQRNGSALAQEETPATILPGRQIMVANYTRTPPVIDGVFSPGEWGGALPV